MTRKALLCLIALVSCCYWLRTHTYARTAVHEGSEDPRHRLATRRRGPQVLAIQGPARRQQGVRGEATGVLRQRVSRPAQAGILAVLHLGDDHVSFANTTTAG